MLAQYSLYSDVYTMFDRLRCQRVELVTRGENLALNALVNRLLKSFNGRQQVAGAIQYKLGKLYVYTLYRQAVYRTA